MNIQEYEISKVVPYKNNPRINVDAVNVVKKSLKEFGFQQPLVIDKDNKIVVGHTRLLAAKELGLKTVPCVVANNLSDEQIKAYRIMDNKSAEFASWNYGLLTKEVTDLLEAEYDFNLTGFDKFELKDLGIDVDLGFVDNPQSDEDEAPVPPANPITSLGDLWVLGSHMVLCGDATKSDDLGLLMKDKKADLYLTDPPYNVDYTGGTKDALKIINDNFNDSNFRAFLTDSFKTSKEKIKKGASFYIFHADLEGYNFRAAVREANFNIKQCLIWCKDSLVLGRSDYQWQHEPILYGWVEGESHSWYSDRKQTTILNFARPTKNKEHPTMKPISIIQYLIQNSSKKEDIVLDTFLGSGSTLIACEKTHRNCYGLELDPVYCDVTIQRWQNFTGNDAIHLETNKTYNELQKDTENGE
jgi:site-specific DNA-methyltransferase (adenine-specific)